MLFNGLFLATKSTTPILGQISTVFGVLMDNIYNFFGSTFGVYSLGLSIIVFTVITRLLLLPLAFKQQKSMKEMQRIQPEMQRIQGKYKEKKDQASQQKMQAELSQLYKTHGVSPMSGCLPLVIQMPIIFALYSVLRNIPAYTNNIYAMYEKIYISLTTVNGFEGKITEVMNTGSNLLKVSKFDPASTEKVVDLLYKFQTPDWTRFFDTFPSLTDTVTPIVGQLNNIYEFMGINLANKPELMSIGILIPILNVLVSLLSMKLTTGKNNASGQAAMTNKTMMYTMPLFTGFICTTLPAGLGLYWLIGNIFQTGQQFFINQTVHSTKVEPVEAIVASKPKKAKPKKKVIKTSNNNYAKKQNDVKIDVSQRYSNYKPSKEALDFQKNKTNKK